MADEPKTYQAVMVSSTFTDLAAHRREVMRAIESFDLLPKAMERNGARADGDVVESSLGLVRDASAYVGLISHKYGQIPECPSRNPDELSITELEFNEAIRLGRPILLFLMAEDHPVTKADVERDPVKIAKLEAFKERAKQMGPDSKTQRVFELFANLEDFTRKATIAAGRLAEYLRRKSSPLSPDSEIGAHKLGDPTRHAPPDLRALPRYLGSHAFVGRSAELGTLDDWSEDSDPNPLLLFEAIGGSGKSMLTWEWITNHAARAREDWAGRFWYSFYERGALMTDFCRQALSYMTSRPVENFSKMRIRELSDRLVDELEGRSWLLVLDGLERVLVAYHRSDAAQLRDDDADAASDQIGKRDPCAAIRPEDDDLLGRLAGVAPSKVLVTSRLTPRALINRSGDHIPGVRREILPGLRPADAEALMRVCGVTGQSKAIRTYLQANCDCHPLVVGALAGLVNDYLPDRGNFDVWVEDPGYGRALNLADLDLTQRRNHILDAAIAALSSEGRQLLETLALLQRGADFEVLKALNPHLPPRPEEVVEPHDPEKEFFWKGASRERRAHMKATYDARRQARSDYLEALTAWQADPAVRAAPRRLHETVRDLERRGLLQYEPGERRYDLHPVVRGVAAGRMDPGKKQERGAQVVNYFNAQMHSAWDEAHDLEDVAPGLQLVATLTQIGRFEEAIGVYRGSLAAALFFNLEANAEILALLKPFFPSGWDAETVEVNYADRTYLLNAAAIALSKIDLEQAKRLGERKCVLDLAHGNAHELTTGLANMAVDIETIGRWQVSDRLLTLALELALANDDKGGVFASLVDLFRSASGIGDFDRADRLWAQLDPMGRDWGRAVYRPGGAEVDRAIDSFRRGGLTEGQLIDAEILAREGRNREGVRTLARLRGQYHLARGEAAKAVGSLAGAVRMARERGADDANAEALLALARLRAGEPLHARAEAERLDGGDKGAALALAELWSDLGERDRAIAAALRAHEWAVAAGEPYVYRHELDQARALLEKFGAQRPDIPTCDPASATPYPWEDDVKGLIEKLKAESRQRD
ncbi:MAG TPA: DUF4062 domain-containing protein [Allosphingosinicella sp.]|nr:DUF4062 domain-containing protein [Allosphingosinicella sp.]